jgi:tyrosinase
MGFRNRLEGWITRSADYRVRKEGVQLHNRVHVWVGGTMARPISPADPVFFLHHCFVDKLWVEWQQRMKAFYESPDNHSHRPLSPANPSPGYFLPLSGGPPGHNLYDTMLGLDHHRIVRPADMLEHHALDYRYDAETEPPTAGHHAFLHEHLRAFSL